MALKNNEYIDLKKIPSDIRDAIVNWFKKNAPNYVEHGYLPNCLYFSEGRSRCLFKPPYAGKEVPLDNLFG